MKVTDRNTKKEILEYVKEIEKQLELEKLKKETTQNAIDRERKQECVNKAEALIEKNILNESIIEEYQALKETKINLEKEIKELYDIKYTANTLEAMIITQEEIKEQNANEYNQKVECLTKEYKSIEDSLKEKEQKLKEDIANMEIDAKKNHKELLDKLALERKRNEEEYTYNLNRQRQKENDAWEDEKATREAELKKREDILTERENSFAEELKTLAALKNTIEEQKKQIEQAYINGKAEGKEKAGKEYGISKAALEKEFKAELRIKENELAMTTDRLNEALSKLSATEEKLETAYNKINETAKVVAQNSGTKIIESKDNK